MVVPICDDFKWIPKARDSKPKIEVHLFGCFCNTLLLIFQITRGRWMLQYSNSIQGDDIRGRLPEFLTRIDEPQLKNPNRNQFGECRRARLPVPRLPVPSLAPVSTLLPPSRPLLSLPASSPLSDIRCLSYKKKHQWLFQKNLWRQKLKIDSQNCLSGKSRFRKNWTNLKIHLEFDLFFVAIVPEQGFVHTAMHAGLCMQNEFVPSQCDFNARSQLPNQFHWGDRARSFFLHGSEYHFGFQF